MITVLNESKGIVISKSQLEKELTDTFNKHFGYDYEELYGQLPSDDYMLRVDIGKEDENIKVSMEAEAYFDENDFIDYGEYKSISRELGETPMSKEEYYRMMYDTPTLKDKMNEVLKKYNREWYFELWNPTKIDAWLDNCILKP